MKTGLSLAARALAACALTLALGCQTTPQYLDANQGQALATAQSRGRFELSCPAVEASVLSRKIIDPGPFGGGRWRAEYTIGVRGCDRQIIYVTICLDNENCNAIADSANMQPAQRR
ncbi:MAG: hypothetical protein ACHQ6T_06660 [Myxococcota bacterium]